MDEKRQDFHKEVDSFLKNHDDKIASYVTRNCVNLKVNSKGSYLSSIEFTFPWSYPEILPSFLVM